MAGRGDESRSGGGDPGSRPTPAHELHGLHGPQVPPVPHQPYRPEEDFLGPPVSLTVSPPDPEPGSAVTLTATVTNTAPVPLRDAVLYLAVDGSGPPSPLGSLAPGATATRSRRTRLADDAEGLVTFTAHALFDVHGHGSDCARATSSARLPSRSLVGAFDNAGIASDDALAVADIDGSRSSLSAEALASAGLTPGAVVTYDGTAFTWPDTRPGSKDNALAAGQTVLLSGAGPRLAFLGTSTWGESRGEGAVLYADGTRQPFSVAVPDWHGAHASAAVVVPYRHIAIGRDDTPVSLFTFGVGLRGGEVRAVVLPEVGDGLEEGVPALHVFAMTIA